MKRLPQLSAPWLQARATQQVFETLEQGGFTARAVGGIVRNTLLGLPATDIDIATNARPEDTQRLAHAAGLKTIPTGLAHGTVTVMAQGAAIEVTTLRRDLATDGRHARVAFTDDWAADASRRDFTINALYCSRHGDLFDPLGGAADLWPVKVRFIGDPTLRISEDYLRILRFFRFTAIYSPDGHLDKEGLAACTSLRDGLARISGERIRTELYKLLTAANAVPVISALIDSGVFAALFDLTPRRNVMAQLVAIELRLARPPDPVLRLCALCVANPIDAAKLDERLKLCVDDRRRLTDLPQIASGLDCEMSERTAKQSAYRVGTAAYIDAIILAWALSGRRVDDCAFLHLVTLPDRWTPPTFPLTGADVLALGIAPGRHVGALLTEFESDWLERDFAAGRAELLAQLRTRAKSITPPKP